MSIQNISDICYEIASRIAEGTGGVRNRSAISASQYVDLTLYDDDDETIGTWSARISDHEARSYNRIGSFNIGVGRLGSDDHEWVRAAWVTEEARENIGAAEAFAACERAAVEQARASLVALAERAQAEGRSVRIGSPPTMQIQHDDDVFASFLTVKVEAIVSEPQRLGVA